MEIKISRLICDPKKQESFNEVLKLVKNSYKENSVKRQEMEQRIAEVR